VVFGKMKRKDNW